MSGQHTPGPWVCTGNYVSARYLTAVGDVILIRRGEKGDDRYVAFATEDAVDGSRIVTLPSEQLANARLIAAAPDAVPLAEAIVAHFAGTDAPLGKMAAEWLAKATGAA